MLQANLTGQFYAIGRRFIARTLDELKTVHEDLAKVRAGNARAATHLQQTAHRIAGSAAVFGFTTISEQAQRIERLAEAIERKRSGSLNPELDTIVIELDRAVQVAARSRGLDRDHGLDENDEAPDSH